MTDDQSEREEAKKRFVEALEAADFEVEEVAEGFKVKRLFVSRGGKDKQFYVLLTWPLSYADITEVADIANETIGNYSDD